MNKIKHLTYFLFLILIVPLKGSSFFKENASLNPYPDLSCEPLTLRYIEVADGNRAYFVLEGFLDCGTCHVVQVRVMGTQTWNISGRSDGFDYQGIWVNGLTPNTNYEYRAVKECGDLIAYTPIAWFNSSGGTQQTLLTTCSDNIKNQGETGVDCGGPCTPCATCDDGIQNQGETGVDCGGPCTPCATCDDGIQNQGETGVDCGGPCEACGTCDDGVKSPGEVGIDCGGSCIPCACDAPILGVVEGIINGGAYLTWSHQAITPAYAFQLQIRTEGYQDWFNFFLPYSEVALETNVYGFRVRGLTANTNYEWRVQAYCSHVDYQSDWSEICSFNSSNPDEFSRCPVVCEAPEPRYIEVADGNNAYFVVDILDRGNNYDYYFVLIRPAGHPGWNPGDESIIFVKHNGYDQQGIWADNVLMPNTNYEYLIGYTNPNGEFLLGDQYACVSPVGWFNSSCGAQPFVETPGVPCANCYDGIQNGDETGVDCGGYCTACPSCEDGIQNGDETGIDCGGSCAPCVCQTPVPFAVFGIGARKAIVYWQYNGNIPAERFLLQIRLLFTQGTSDWYDFSVVDVEQDDYGYSFELKGLPTEINIEWRVKAICDGGNESDFSEICSFYSSNPDGYSNCEVIGCEAPSQLYVNNVDGGGWAGFGWLSNLQSPSFKVEIRKKGNTDWDETLTQIITNPQFWPEPAFYYTEATALATDTYYEWQVSVECSPGVWTPSDLAEFILVSSQGNSKKAYSSKNVTSLGTTIADLQVFPNPANHILNVKIPPLATSDGSISLLDYTGKTVLVRQIESGASIIELNVSAIPKGFYIVQFKDENFIQLKRIIVQ